MFGWKPKGQFLRNVMLAAGWQYAKPLAFPVAQTLEILREGVAGDIGKTWEQTVARLDALPSITDTERPKWEQQQFGVWDVQVTFYTKDEVPDQYWWLVRAVSSRVGNDNPVRPKDIANLRQILEFLGSRPDDDTIIAPWSSPTNNMFALGYWTWRNVAPLEEIQVHETKKGAMRRVRRGTPESHGFKRVDLTPQSATGV